MSRYLLWRQIQGDSALEIVSTGSKINMWAMVSHLLKIRLNALIKNLALQLVFYLILVQTL